MTSQFRRYPERRPNDDNQRNRQIIGTADKDYNLIWFTRTCLKNTLRLETFIGDAQRGGDSELAELRGAALISPLVPFAVSMGWPWVSRL